jgi:catechol 2,3-dioxygenase-like lactoylglutathione lyase family enzyme
MSTNAITRGAHHIGLTVTDLARTQAFFRDALGLALLAELPDYPAAFLSDGTTMITLWQAETPANAVPFDRRNVIGLHHLAFNVEDAAALEALHERLAARGDVAVEFAPEKLGDGPARHMMCAIPDGIRIEFIAAAG